MFEPGGRFTGRWYRASGAFSSTSEQKITWTTDETPNGISHSSGDFTVAQPGRWRLTANILGPNATTTLAARIGTSSLTWATDSRGSAVAPACTLSTELALPTGQVFAVYVTPGSTTAPSTTSPFTDRSFNFTATYVGPM